jgi:transcriptional regulator with XRE-family HTH domain
MTGNNKILPKDKRILKQLGENLKLARLRRKYSAEMVAERAGISRTTLWNIEKGNSVTSIYNLLKVLSVYGLENDLIRLAEDDNLGRKIQDAKLSVKNRVRKK